MEESLLAWLQALSAKGLPLPLMELLECWRGCLAVMFADDNIEHYKIEKCHEKERLVDFASVDFRCAVVLCGEILCRDAGIGVRLLAEPRRVKEEQGTERLLERVGLSSPEEQDHETSPLTESTMRRLVVYPLPKNMGPGESEGRRAARARALLLQHQNDEGAVYVDVAKVKNKDAYVAAAVAATTGKIVTSCSVRTRSASQAEEMAIALAARSPGVRTILSDSKTAIRSFSRGAVCGAAARALASDESNVYHSTADTPWEEAGEELAVLGEHGKSFGGERNSIAH
ncbi:hypothetical protein MRX96_025584 [Rhipicephalus microplus]